MWRLIYELAVYHLHGNETVTFYEMCEKIRYHFCFSIEQFFITFTGNLDISDYRYVCNILEGV